MSNKEFILFLQLIIKLLEKGDSEEVIKLLKDAAKEIEKEQQNQ